MLLQAPPHGKKLNLTRDLGGYVHTRFLEETDGVIESSRSPLPWALVKHDQGEKSLYLTTDVSSIRDNALKIQLPAVKVFIPYQTDLADVFRMIREQLGSSIDRE